MLIDYEYGDWNPMAYDIANFFNEFTRDNIAPHGKFDCGIQYYEKNFPTRPEREIFAKEYLAHFYKRIENREATEEDIEKYCQQNLEPFMKEIEQCLMLNSFAMKHYNLIIRSLPLKNTPYLVTYQRFLFIIALLSWCTKTHNKASSKLLKY